MRAMLYSVSGVPGPRLGPEKASSAPGRLSFAGMSNRAAPGSRKGCSYAFSLNRVYRSEKGYLSRPFLLS